MLELAVLAVLGATLSTVVFAGWNSGRDRLALDNAASQLSGVLQAGRFQAIRRNQPVAVYLSPGTNRVITEVVNSTTPICNNPANPIIDRLDLDDSIDGLTVIWNTSGTSTDGVVWQANGLAASCGGGLANQSINLNFNGNAEQLTISGTAGRVQKQ